MTRDYTLFIRDILDAIIDIEKFIGNSEYKRFIKDEKTKSTVVWKIQVIGEVSKNIPAAMQEK